MKYTIKLEVHADSDVEAIQTAHDVAACVEIDATVCNDERSYGVSAEGVVTLGDW